MPSAVASAIFAIVTFLLISLLVLLLLRHYLPLRSTPAFLILPIFLALVLPANVVLLVPVDLASSARVEDEASKGIWLPERAVLILWRITYWLTFILTWVVLPLLGEYLDAGHREPKHRLLYSLRMNGRYQLIVLGCGAAGLVYMSIQNGFNFTAIKALVMALAYVWGLILAIYLMGHGLVALPRRLFRNANNSGRLRRIQTSAPKVHVRMEDAMAKLEELEGQVIQLRQRKTGTAREFQDWIDELVDMTSLPESRVRANPNVREATSRVPAIITERYLADLTRRLNRARHERARFLDAWDYLIQEAADVQAILDSRASQKLDFGRSSPNASFLGGQTFITPYLRYHLYTHVLPVLRIFLGLTFSLASVCIIWSETIKFPAPHLSAVSLTVVHRPTDKDYQIGLGGQLIAAGWIMYMCMCALGSVNDVPVWGNRALVRRNTYGESACWYAGQLAKLTVPLSYNFLTFLPTHIQTQTTFYHFLGRLINLTPLGTGFDYFFPILVLFPVCATFFNLYNRIKNILGFGIMEDEEDEDDNPSGFGTSGWRAGRDLIENELRGQAPHVQAGGTGALGLSPRPSRDVDRASTPRTAPTLWVPPPHPHPESANRSASTQPPVSRPSRLALDADPTEENIFTLFGRRMKNTIDTIDAPRWMQNTSDSRGGGSTFRRPSWIGGDVQGDSGRADSGRGLGRWFGGRPVDGRVRL